MFKWGRKRALGPSAEAYAADYLRAKGLKLLLQNYHCRLGELDLVMQDGADIAVIEVRARKAGSTVSALESISAQKQRKIIAASRHCMMQHPQWAESAWRYDVFCADGEHSEWIKDAFQDE